MAARFQCRRLVERGRVDRLWELENGGNIKSISAHGGGVESVRFAKDGRLVSTGRDRMVRVWDPSGNKQRDFEAFGDLALEAVFSHDESKVIAADWSGEIRVWDTKDGKRLANLAVNPAPIAVRMERTQQAMTAARAEADSLSKQLPPLQAAVAARVSAQAKAQQELSAAEAAATKQAAAVVQQEEILKVKMAAFQESNATAQAAEQIAAQAQAALIAHEKAVGETAAAEKAAVAAVAAAKAATEKALAEKRPRSGHRLGRRSAQGGHNARSDREGR